MKAFIFTFFILFVFVASSCAQQVIRAKEAYRHVGERLIVRDSVYFGKVYNDSTVVVELGSRRLISPLTVIFSAGKNPRLSDQRYLSSYLQSGRISVYGVILLIKGHPSMIVSDWNNLKFDQPGYIANQ